MFPAPRSSLSWKSHIDVGGKVANTQLYRNCYYIIISAGVIDRDYRGNVGVVLFNLSKCDYKVKKGDRIAQLILERIYTPPLVEVQVSFTIIILSSQNLNNNYWIIRNYQILKEVVVDLDLLVFELNAIIHCHCKVKLNSIFII